MFRQSTGNELGYSPVPMLNVGSQEAARGLPGVCWRTFSTVLFPCTTSGCKEAAEGSYWARAGAGQGRGGLGEGRAGLQGKGRGGGGGRAGDRARKLLDGPRCSVWHA